MIASYVRLRRRHPHNPICQRRIEKPGNLEPGDPEFVCDLRLGVMLQVISPRNQRSLQFLKRSTRHVFDPAITIEISTPSQKGLK